ncbi:TAXI family TRAP transporter solute-binding subunit [Elioraea sp. Yellowstone]|jgi:TRAP transporter TAXI family solute receptor|uniref:TAXI family TRAP transporter solute-binding subunit n=1 Tax=Elioraea sp. Yellowstone TaxID=2592070 RepID=UPI001150F437|nr:TAXI family TRAP transporter solute-binding subunit [Elioraea sp. Yellowstone]TQF84504.1 TAXI family TRAP transporter solute-binding subunit [Elioraea sp. Yellowstone]
MIRRRTLLVSTTLAGTGLAAPALRAQPKNASWPRTLTMGTAAPGGTYAIYGPAWGQLAAQATGVNISYRTTQGPNQNIVLVDQKQVELGMVTMGVALQAWNGTGEWTRGTRFRNIRALFPMYDTPFHAVALKRSGITDHAQLNGKSVGVGPRGGTPGTYYPLMLKAIGVTPSRIGYGSASDLIGQVSDGLLDCFAFAAGAPIPAFSEIETTNEVTIFGFTDAQMDAIVKELPELSKGELPAGTYRSQTAPIKILGVYNFAIGHKDLPEDLVYEIVKSVMTQNAALVQATAAAKETVPQNVTKNTFLPFHPGAAKWFRENGHAIPDNLIMA